MEGCPVPVVIAGGPRTDTEAEFLEMVADAIGAGARGVAIGRNVFQHQDPTLITRRLSSIVHREMTAEEALEMEM